MVKLLLLAFCLVFCVPEVAYSETYENVWSYSHKSYSKSEDTSGYNIVDDYGNRCKVINTVHIYANRYKRYFDCFGMPPEISSAFSDDISFLDEDYSEGHSYTYDLISRGMNSTGLVYLSFNKISSDGTIVYYEVGDKSLVTEYINLEELSEESHVFREYRDEDGNIISSEPITEGLSHSELLSGMDALTNDYHLKYSSHEVTRYPDDIDSGSTGNTGSGSTDGNGSGTDGGSTGDGDGTNSGTDGGSGSTGSGTDGGFDGGSGGGSGDSGGSGSDGSSTGGTNTGGDGSTDGSTDGSNTSGGSTGGTGTGNGTGEGEGDGEGDGEDLFGEWSFTEELPDFDGDFLQPEEKEFDQSFIDSIPFVQSLKGSGVHLSDESGILETQIQLGNVSIPFSLDFRLYSDFFSSLGIFVYAFACFVALRFAMRSY